MNKIYVLHKDELRGELYRRVYRLIRKNLWTRQSIGAGVGVSGGLLSIIIGSFLWAEGSLLSPGSLRAFLNGAEIIFFALSLPLLALGAHYLDLLEIQAPILPLPANSQPDGSGRLPGFRAQASHKKLIAPSQSRGHRL